MGYLTNKTREVSVAEIFRQNFSSEGYNILDHKPNSILFPADHVLKLRMLTNLILYLQDLISFDQKGSDSVARSACGTNLPLRHNVEFYYRTICVKEANLIHKWQQIDN